MTRKVNLYHHSRACFEEIEEIKKNGLSSKSWRPCVGGQQEGFYFFTRKLFAKRWAMAGSAIGYLCEAQISEKEIKYPDWQLDLFFNRSIIDRASKTFRKLYANKADKNGFVELKLDSNIAFDDIYERMDYSFWKYPVEIDGLKFEQKRCMVLYHRGDEKLSVELSSCRMGRDFLGIADTLIGYLCKKDEKFLSCYNKKLHDNVSSGLDFGAIKCVKPQNIPVSVQPYNEFKDPLHPLWWILGYLVQCYAELKDGGCKQIMENIKNDTSETCLAILNMLKQKNNNSR